MPFKVITLAVYARALNRNTTPSSTNRIILKFSYAKRSQFGFANAATPTPIVVNKPTTIHKKDPFKRWDTILST